MNTFVLFFLLAISEPAGQVTYVQETNLEGNYYKYLDGEVLLRFTDRTSIYIHLNVPEKGDVKQNGSRIEMYNGDQQGFPIYKDIREDKLTWKVAISTVQNCVVQDTIPHIDWKIQPDDTRQIGKYTCRKAVGIFGGRVYDAWFTPEIPVPHGPYKLGGLPGLILEAHSRDGKVSFHFKSFEWVELSQMSIKPPVEQLTFSSRAAYLQRMEDILERRRANLRSNGVTVTVAKYDSIIEKQ